MIHDIPAKNTNGTVRYIEHTLARHETRTRQQLGPMMMMRQNTLHSVRLSITNCNES